MKKKSWIYTLLLCLFAAVFLVSATVLGIRFFTGRREEKRYEALSQMLPTVERPQPPAPGEPLPTVPESELVTVTDPQTGESLQILPRFLQLYDLNPHIIGWLEIPGTKVNYPVMHTPDDPEYYLKRNFDRKSSAAGCLFLQAEAEPLRPSDNLTVYGHHMKNGSMFAALDKYRKKAFFEENRYIYFDTLQATQTYEVLAVFKTNVSEGEGFHYHEFVDAADAAEFDAYVQKCKKLSYYDTGVDATYGDQLLTLSTCEYSQPNGRLVVVAKRIA